ncbi:MAG: hypothetical protein Q9174_006171, partial [Haloplaca sp. 1 TL-2023]
NCHDMLDHYMTSHGLVRDNGVEDGGGVNWDAKAEPIPQTKSSSNMATSPQDHSDGYAHTHNEVSPAGQSTTTLSPKPATNEAKESTAPVPEDDETLWRRYVFRSSTLE